MRVLPAGVLLTLVCLPMTADEPVWKMDLLQRAIRRADPQQNAARRAAWIAKGRPGIPDADDSIIEGSYDPSVLAPIELVLNTYPVFNLERERQERFRRDWESRGARQLLGPDYWETLRTVFQRAIFLDNEARHSRRPDEDPCSAEADALQAGRARWGEAFDRFLYESVAPGVYFSVSSSAPALMHDPDHWVETWTFREKGCNFENRR